MTILAEDLQVIKDAVADQVKITVNGKIDKIDKKIDEHNASHERDMKRALPVIEAYEAGQEVVRSMQKTRAWIMRVAAFIIAVGGAWVTIEQILPSFHIKL